MIIIIIDLGIAASHLPVAHIMYTRFTGVPDYIRGLRDLLGCQCVGPSEGFRFPFAVQHSAFSSQHVASVNCQHSTGCRGDLVNGTHISDITSNLSTMGVEIVG